MTVGFFCRLMMSSRHFSPARLCGVSFVSRLQGLQLPSVSTATLQVSSRHIKHTVYSPVEYQSEAEFPQTFSNPELPSRLNTKPHLVKFCVKDFLSLESFRELSVLATEKWLFLPEDSSRISNTSYTILILYSLQFSTPQVMNRLNLICWNFFLYFCFCVYYIVPSYYNNYNHYNTFFPTYLLSSSACRVLEVCVSVLYPHVDSSVVHHWPKSQRPLVLLWPESDQGQQVCLH